ncbi:MFS general substrate transporter [Decorospora gaudefroyi]|uniref:MFS general substrate transporter n=1 Tax=Decorospora gaudefroyi TaxID=184978 RepID=A0A6A5KIH7_9PLEO|nr:MFS general substrate transporter [Decorospora gaudefroyi]
MQEPGPHMAVPGHNSEANSWDGGKHEADTAVEEAINLELENSSYLRGWRLHLASLSTCLCLFLVNSEVSVVGTALVSVVKDLDGIDQMGWVITGYLITYTSMIIIWAKLSDIFGRKYTAIATVLIFTAFSGACGAAQTMNQMIISRVFQGIGAAGCWSVPLTIGYEMVPKHRHPIQGAQFMTAGALGSLAGPLIGGSTSQSGQWRWAFLFCVPLGVATIILLQLALPASFPHQGDPQYQHPTWRERISRKSLSRLDVSGAFLLLGGTMLIVAVLLEGGLSIAWSSGPAIALFVVSGVMWIAFLGNEWFFTKHERTLEPIFPWRFMHNKPWMGTLIFSFLSGIPYNILIINVPQRYQDVAGTSPLTAAIRLIPFNIFISVTGFVVNGFIAKRGVACVWILLVGSLLQVGGLAWFCVLPEDGTIPLMIYGAQILTGLGIGAVMGITLLMPPLVVEKRDTAISSGALLQFRALGGVLGLSITTTAFNNYLKTHLFIFDSLSTSDMLKAVQSARDFSPEIQHQIITRLAEAYNLQMKILIGFSALQIFVIAMIWRKGNQIRVVDAEEEKAASSSASNASGTTIATEADRGAGKLG